MKQKSRPQGQVEPKAVAVCSPSTLSSYHLSPDDDHDDPDHVYGNDDHGHDDDRTDDEEYIDDADDGDEDDDRTQSWII